MISSLLNAWRVVAFALLCALSAQAASAVPETPRLQGLTPSDAQVVIGKLVDAQRAVRNNEKVYFELSSGAPASYDATLVAPRRAFLDVHFEKPDVVERLDAPNSLWHPYRLTYFGKKGNELMWEVEVVLGFENRLERVQMLYKPPPPF